MVVIFPFVVEWRLTVIFIIQSRAMIRVAFDALALNSTAIANPRKPRTIKFERFSHGAYLSYASSLAGGSLKFAGITPPRNHATVAPAVT